MTYTIDTGSLMADIKEEISRFAADAVDENGGSLYDMLRAKSRDENILSGYCDEALGSICMEMADIAVFSNVSIEFNVPDFDMSFTTIAKNSLDRYIVYAVCALWFEEKGQEVSKVYAGRASIALNKAHTLLKSRKAPKRENI